jgi:putative membrane protein
MFNRPISQIVAILILPVLVGLAVLGAVSPSPASESVSAALVNQDEPVTTSDGSTMPAGRLLTGRLLEPSSALTEESTTAATDDTLDFSVVGKSDAEVGLDDGTYDAIVVIPEDFSRNIVGTLEGTPTDATVQVRTNDTTSQAIGELTQQVVSAAASSLGTTITVGYLDASFASMTDLHSSLSQAADGAGDLADGAETMADGLDSAAGGASQVTSGASDLSEGMNALQSGASRLSSGADDLSSGMSTLASGAMTLASGASDVASGASDLADGASDVASGAATVADGVDAYTDGVQQVYDGMTTPQDGASQSLVDGAKSAADGAAALQAAIGTDSDTAASGTVLGALNDLSGQSGYLNSSVGEYTKKVDDLSTSCATLGGSAPICGALEQLSESSDDLRKGVAGYTDGVDKLHTTVTTVDPATGVDLAGATQALATGTAGVSDGVSKVSTGIDINLLGTTSAKLDSGSRQLASALAQASGGASTLASGVASVSSGASTLADGTSSAASGASDLASGASDLDSGVSDASSGASALATGAAQLDDGVRQLDAGAPALANGSKTLSSQLSKGASQIPTHSSDEASDLADSLAQPVSVDVHEEANTSTRAGVAPAATSTALWIAGLTVILLLGVMSSRSVDAAMSPMRVLGTGLRPALVLAVVQALLMAAVLAIWGGGLGSPAGTVGLLVLGAVTMTVVHSALMAALGTKMGAAASVLLLVVQVASLDALFPGAGQNGFFGVVRAVLPLPALEAALQNRLVGPIGSGAGGSVAILVAWLAVSAVVAVMGVMRRRSTTVAEIRSAIAHA